MSNKNGTVEVKNKNSWDFNEYINLILLSMFVIVVLTILCFKCCPCCNQLQKKDTEKIQQPMGLVNDSIQTQQ